jgi:hypothetical protein
MWLPSRAVSDMKHLDLLRSLAQPVYNEIDMGLVSVQQLS